MKITIRKSKDEDFPAILSLIKELAAYVNSPEKVTNSVEQMKNEKAYFECLVAETEEKEIIGIALYFFAYYSLNGKSLYLDDLYIKETFRGQKIGTHLLQKIFEIAKIENCTRVRWQVLSRNKKAVEFYKKFGAVFNNEEINCDFDKSGIREFKIED